MPSVANVYHNIHRWERGDNEPTERYKLYYCKTLGIPAAGFGAEVPGADSLSPIATVNSHGLSVSLGYVSGLLSFVIEISGLDAREREAEPGLVVARCTSQECR